MFATKIAKLFYPCCNSDSMVNRRKLRRRAYSKNNTKCQQLSSIPTATVAPQSYHRPSDGVDYRRLDAVSQQVVPTKPSSFIANQFEKRPPINRIPSSAERMNALQFMSPYNQNQLLAWQQPNWQSLGGNRSMDYPQTGYPQFYCNNDIMMMHQQQLLRIREIKHESQNYKPLLENYSCDNVRYN